MASYESSPPDEGYSEDPLTLGTSAMMPSWMSDMSEQERLGTCSRKRTAGLNDDTDMK